MSVQPFGAILRQQREALGISVSEAAESLRIRPDVLHSIEETDFYRMPPRGFTRNMISKYARMLNLNSSEITRMYLDDAYAYEVEKARGDAKLRNSTYSTRPGARSQEPPTRSRFSPERPSRNRNEEEYSMRSSGRMLYSSDNRSGQQKSSERNRSPLQSRQQGNGRGARSFTRRVDSREGRDTGQSKHYRQTQSFALPNMHYTNYYANTQHGGNKRTIIIAAGVIVAAIIIILILVNFVFKGPDQSEDVTSIPISGLTDPESGGVSTTNGSQDTITPPAPTNVNVSYSVDAGQESYIELYIDGQVKTAQTVTGPSKESFDITGTAEFVTTNPTGTHLRVGGEEIKLTDDNEDGVYSYSVDFQKYLDDWKAKHSNTGSSSTSSSTSSDSTDSTSTTNGEGQSDSAVNSSLQSNRSSDSSQGTQSTSQNDSSQSDTSSTGEPPR